MDRDTRDDHLLARCYDILAAARASLAGDKVFTSPDAPDAAPQDQYANRAPAVARGGGGGGGGRAGDEPPLPAGWVEQKSGLKKYWTNDKTKMVWFGERAESFAFGGGGGGGGRRQRRWWSWWWCRWFRF